MSAEIHSLHEKTEAEMAALCSGWVALLTLENFDNYITLFTNVSKPGQRYSYNSIKTQNVDSMLF